MIEIKNIPSYIVDDEVRKVLNIHINQMFKTCIVFIGALTEKGKKFNFWDNVSRKKALRDICPIYVNTDEERSKIILSLLRKLYSEDMEELTVEEKFVLFKSSYAAIEKEEEVIAKLSNKEDLSLENWMWSRYMIEDTDDRRKVLKHLEEQGIGVEHYPKHILEDKPVQEREHVLDAIGQTNMLIFEYPTALNLAFDKQEYEFLAGAAMDKGVV